MESTYEQLDLFSSPSPAGTSDEERPANPITVILPVTAGGRKEKTGPAVKTPAKKKTEKIPLPTALASSRKNYGPDELRQLLDDLGVDGLTVTLRYRDTFRYMVKGREVIFDGKHTYSDRPYLALSTNNRSWGRAKTTYRTTALYVDFDGNCWAREVSVTVKDDFPCPNYTGSLTKDRTTMEEITVTPWTILNKLLYDYSAVQSEETITNILSEAHPYAALFAQKNGYDLVTIAMAPQLETLDKAGYAFTSSFRNVSQVRKSDVENFNLLCQKGTNPKDIFKTTKDVYSVLKDETDLEKWNTFRKLRKTNSIPAENVRDLYDSDMTPKELELAREVLARKYDGKNVFSWTSLINYLGRLDMFEAIPRELALQLLNDYLRMCQNLGVEPRTDGDSLKREHDVLARTSREVRNEKLASEMDAACKANSIYNYEEADYLVRAIRDYDDLLDEARQQHNCVASYGPSIAKGRSLIFVMREKEHPEKSLITIELNKDLHLRQKLQAYNTPIRNKAQTEFIERWLGYIKGL